MLHPFFRTAFSLMSSWKVRLASVALLATTGLISQGGLAQEGVAQHNTSLKNSKPLIGAVARHFPDTRDKIAIFTDQLPTELTDAQWHFIATHYVGTQKMPRSWARHIRQLNPTFIILHYQLALGAGPAPFLEGEKWINDFAAVTQHEDWFLHDDTGHRLLQPDWKWYVMDIRFQDGKPQTGFPGYWLNTALQRMRANEDDGCFADSYTQDILMNQLKPSFRWFTDAEANKTNWLPQLNQFGAFCAKGFHQQPEHFYYLPNLGGLVTSWDNITDLLVGDGGMNEGFCAPGPETYFSEGDWKLQMSRLLNLASHEKIILCQTSIKETDLNHRRFVLGSYLLVKGRHSYLNMMHQSSLEWYPEYNLDLGPYQAEPVADVMSYWNPEWKVFRRDYVKGMVLVNPGETSVSIPNLGESLRLVEVTGGGAIKGNGQTSGSFSATQVHSLTIPAHSARVLLKGT